MTDHVKLTLQDINPDHIVLHAGTNDLTTENTVIQTAINCVWQSSKA